MAAEVTCNDVIRACDDALKKKDQVITLYDLTLKDSMTNSARLQADVDRKDAQLNSVFRNPFVMFGLGFIGGVVVMSLH